MRRAALARSAVERVAASHPITASRGGTPATPIERSGGLASSSAATTRGHRRLERQRRGSDQSRAARAAARRSRACISSRCISAGEDEGRRGLEPRDLSQQGKPGLAGDLPAGDEIGKHDHVGAGRGGIGGRRASHGSLNGSIGRRLQDVERLALGDLPSGSISRTSPTRLRRASACASAPPSGPAPMIAIVDMRGGIFYSAFHTSAFNRVFIMSSQVAIITGGSKGIGLAIARALLDRGMQVASAPASRTS